MRLFHEFGKNVARCFKNRNLVWQIVAWALTYFIVISGLDWAYFEWTRAAILRSIFFPAAIIGGLLPLLIPLLLLARKESRRTGWALGQAAILGWLISSFYKAFTGRIPPPRLDVTTDISREFLFGFFRHGIFWGWPSSHTTIAFAMSFALIVLYPRNKILRYGALIYALYICIGTSLTIHWLSESIAGAIIGTVIGVVVGQSFKAVSIPTTPSRFSSSLE